MSYERLHEELFTTCVPNNWQRVAPVTAEPLLPWHAELSLLSWKSGNKCYSISIVSKQSHYTNECMFMYVQTCAK